MCEEIVVPELSWDRGQSDDTVEGRSASVVVADALRERRRDIERAAKAWDAEKASVAARAGTAAGMAAAERHGHHCMTWQPASLLSWASRRAPPCRQETGHPSAFGP